MAAHPQEASSALRDAMLADHRRIENQLMRVVVSLEAVDRDRVATEWMDFHRAIFAHLNAEDLHLIPLLTASRPREARALLQEHRHIRARAIELGEALEKGSLGADTVRGFVDEVSAHVHHETRVLYEWADDELDDDDRESLLRAVAPTARPASKERGPGNA